jgi:HSP20 family protein
MGYNNVFDDVDNLFNAMVSPFSRMRSPRQETRDSFYTDTVPRVNILKEDNGYTMELAAPGFSRSDFGIAINDNVLTISANSEVNSDYTEALTTQEYFYNSFSRSWSLPVNTYKNGIDASYEAGILSVKIPVEAISEKSIQVEVK